MHLEFLTLVSTEELIGSGDKMFSSFTGKGIWFECCIKYRKKIRERKKELCEICTDCVTQRHKKSLQR